MATMRLAPFGGNTRSLEGSSTSRDGAECPGRALVAWGGGASVCLSMGNVGRGAWVSPRGEPRRWPLASFSEATCSLEGSSASRDGAECTGRALVAWGEGRPCAF